MVFSSITFLFYFLPLIVIFYYLSPRKLKNYILLFASLTFYGWGEPKYILLMLLSIGVNYILGILIERYSDTILAKIWLLMSVVFSLGLLGYFKYMDFFISNINALTGLSLPLINVVLPVGISFYTFQILSYTIDVYRKNCKAQRNIVYLATYVVFFPQLIAGPIVRYTDIMQELTGRRHTVENIRIGIRRFLIGLSKKVLIANNLGELCDIFAGTQERTVLLYWIYAIAFTLQIYFDFSGYSDMGIGLGKIFGFEFHENFKYPFISKSITEFWRRWHISLGSWFRDYLYIPLGGNRVSRARWFINIVLVWLLTGLWHGASWNFVIWGLLFAVLLIFEKYVLQNRWMKLPTIISHAYVIFVVIISFVVFNASDLSDALEQIRSMFGGVSIPFMDTISLYYLRSYLFVLIVAVIASTPLLKYMVTQLVKMKYGRAILNIAEPIVCILLLLISTAYLVDGSFNPFLYFRF